MALGEFELIEAVREAARQAGAPPGANLVLGSGDDAAVTRAPGATVTSVDALVEGVHFRRPAFPPEAIGRKALAAALSDLAAMGAEPGEAYVQLGLPDDMEDEEVLALARGLGAAAGCWGIALAGGDVTRAPALFLALTAVGYVDAPERAVGRAGARPGDVLAVTGELGGAAAGLMALARPGLAAGLAPEVVDALRARQLDPEPRLAAGRALAAVGASAMIDVSDGLAADAAHIAERSGVRAEIEAEAVPAQPGVAEVAAAAGADPLDLVLAGGEDYELLAALAPARLGAAVESLARQGIGLSRVGAVSSGYGTLVRERSGRLRPAPGFDHRRGRVRARAR